MANEESRLVAPRNGVQVDGQTAGKSKLSRSTCAPATTAEWRRKPREPSPAAVRKATANHYYLLAVCGVIPGGLTRASARDGTSE
jgi:hypothetical protein